MGRGSRPFDLEVRFVECKDAQERLNKAYAIILKAGRRHRQQQREATEAEAVAARDEAVASS